MPLNKNSKLIVVKSLPSKLINISEVLKADIEASNRGILGLSSSGLLTLVAWIKKKVLIKHIEDVSDALWQMGGQSEVVAACHSGAMFRYTLHEDTGLTKSLQLSSKSLLALINSKDSSISSLKSLRIWGHTKEFILLQPQPDRLVLLATNSESKPAIIGILKADSLQSAHLTKDKIIVQPFSGSDLYIHDTTSCKTIEVLTLLASRPNVSYIQWDNLACSTSGSRIAITDSERRVYLAKLDEKSTHGKKRGLIKSRVITHQVVWPAIFQPSALNNILINLSEDLLSVFCSIVQNSKEVSYYLTYDFNKGGRLVLQHTFEKCASILPGLPHGLPDLFLTEDGICMLSDKECSDVRPSIDSEFSQLLQCLQKALNSQDMDKIYRIKTSVEEDLSQFLSSCNHQENWIEQADSRSKQHAELVNIILSYLTIAASTYMNRTTLLGLKELAHHHFKTLQDEMSNVLKYVDAKPMAQLLLQMIEQMNFYSKSVETLRLPEGKEEDRIILEKFVIWADRPVKEILEDSLKTCSVNIAEQYLSLKPWIYGQIDSKLIVSYCVDIARQNISTNLLINMDHSYKDDLKEKLYHSKELNEIRCLEGVLSSWGELSAKEQLAISLVKYVHKFSPFMIFKTPRIWSSLIEFRKESTADVQTERELNIGTVVGWNSESIHLILIDIFARSNDPEILAKVDMSKLWTYFLIREDENHLLKWISSQFEQNHCNKELITEGICTAKDIREFSLPNFSATEDEQVESKTTKSVKIKHFVKRHEKRPKNLMTAPMYESDTESLYSLESSIWEGVDGSLCTTSESSTDSLSHYTVTEFPSSCFVFITQLMIDDVCIGSFSISEKILDILAQYGLFQSLEKKNAQTMVKRLFSYCPDLQFKPLNLEYDHKISKEAFDKIVLKTLADYNMKTPFFEYASISNIDLKHFDLSEERKTHWVNLIIPFQELRHTQGKEAIYQLCLENLYYTVSANDSMIEDFFAVFLTMLFAPNALLSDFINLRKTDTNSVTDNSKARNVDALCSILAKQHMTPLSVIEKLAYGDFPFLQTLVIERQPSNQFDISIYDLLRGAVPFDLCGLFTWQKKNKYGFNNDAEQPSFTDESLNKRDEAICTLDYFYFLKGGRPTYALSTILLSIYEDKIKRLKDIELPVYGFALYSWPDSRICSACIALLYLTELNYEPLRIILFSGDLIVKTFEQVIFRDIHENLRKSQMKFVIHEVGDAFNLICNSSTRKMAALNFISFLEFALIARVAGRKMNSDESFNQFRKEGDDCLITESFCTSEKFYFIILGIKLSKEIATMFDLSLPIGILKFLANNGQWFFFLTAIQLFQYPEEIVTPLTLQFKTISLREHIQFSLLNSKTVHSKVWKSEHGDNVNESSPCFASSNNFKTESFNVHTESNLDDSPATITTESFNGKTDRDLVGFSAAIMTQFQNEEKNESVSVNGEIIQDFKLSLTQFSICLEGDSDFFSVITKCCVWPNPSISLIRASIWYKCPQLAVIAAYYDQSNIYGCFATWLLVQVSDSKLLKMEIYDTSIIFEEGLEKTEYSMLIEDFKNLDSLCKLLKKLFSIFYSNGSIDILEKGLQIFDDISPVLPILKGLKSAKAGRNIETITDILYAATSNFVLCATCETKVKFFSDLCIIAVCNGLENYLKNRYLQRVFIDALIPYANEHPFVSQNTDWNVLNGIIAILETTKADVNIFKLSGTEVQLNFRNIGVQLIQILTIAEEYKAAFHVAQCLGLDSGEIFCSQLKSEFAQLNNDSLQLSVMKSFLKDAHNKINKNNISSDKACKMFESLAADPLCPLYKYLCLQYSTIWAHTYKKDIGATQYSIGELSKQTPSGLLSKPIEWLKYLECVEFKMWLSYIEHLLLKDTKLEIWHLSLPLELGNWPWEIGEEAKYLDYSYVTDASALECKLFRESELWNSTNFCDMLIKKLLLSVPKLEVNKDIIEESISNIINGCWRKELVITSCRIANHFNFHHNDVTTFLNMLMKTCDCSFPEKISTSESTKVVRKLSMSGRGLNIGVTYSNGSILSFNSDDQRQLWLSTILKLSTDLSHCNEITKRVITLCRVADAISVPYLIIIHHQNLCELLVAILTVKCSDSVQLAKEFVSSYPISTTKVNKLLLDEVMFAVLDDSEENEETKAKHFLSRDSLDFKWVETIPISDEPSTIGYKLMNVIKSLLKNIHPDNVAKAQIMSVELMIRAHDCFSHAAHMEGINVILQAVPELTKSLLKHKQWTLMGRLLTGIRRYQEMSYMIDLLREHQQFEILLGKNSVKKMQSSGLDKALIHYLRFNYPEDKEMLRMVSLHFLMYTELAKMWEEDGEEIIEKVIRTYVQPATDKTNTRSSKSRFFPLFLGSPSNSQPSPVANNDAANSNPSTLIEIDFLKAADVNLLSEAMRCFYYASQYCVQEKQLVSGMQHSRRAELIALQISLVKSAGCSGQALRILKLTPQVLSLVLSQHLSVREIIIVSRSYDANPEWASSLHFHYIKNGFKKFLDDFLHFNDLSSDIVANVVRKMEKAAFGPNEKERMSVMLSYIEEVDFVYKIASQLDIRHQMEECLEPPLCPYLKDTVFNQGITASCNF